MNIYILVEGITEKHIYRNWISELNRKLTPVNMISEITRDNYIIYTGGGYPGYFEMIDDAIETINTNIVFDRLVICVDSEDYSREEKYDEIKEYTNCFTNY